jgi:hypothetical protein
MLKYGPRDFGVTGVHQGLTGTPFLQTMFDDPNTFRPGAAPGEMTVAPKPLLPRNPTPATQPPQPDIYQHSAPPPFLPGAYEGMRVDDPNFKQPETPKPQSFFERNADLIGPRGMLWRDLGAMGRGMLTARPGQNPYGMGFAEINEDRYEREFRDARLDELRARGDERKSQQERRKAYGDFIKSLPEGHPLKKWGPFMSPEKLAEKVFERPGPGMEMDPDTGKWRANKEWLEAQIELRRARGEGPYADTALMKNARFIAETQGISLEEAVRQLRAGTQGPMTTDRAAMDAYIKANPGKTAWDYQQEKARLRGGAKPTALMQNSQYLARTLGIPEAEAARIMSQSREQSDRQFYSTIYGRAINSPMVAGDPARADEIAKQAVAARRRSYAAPGSQSDTPTRRQTATGPNGRRIYTEDGGRTWYNMDGTPYRP